MKLRQHYVRAAALPGLLLACAFALAEPLPAPPAQKRAPIPFKQDESSMGELALRSLGGLLLAGAAAYGIAVGLKRLNGGPGAVLRKARALRPTATIRLGKNTTLHVVEYHDEELLLADSAQGLQLLRSRALARAGNDPKNGGQDA